MLVEVEGGEDQDLRCVGAGHPQQSLGGGHAVEDGHADVHQHDVRPCAQAEVDRPVAVPGLADHLEVVLGLEEHPEAGADEGLVVDDGDADERGHGISEGMGPVGRTARTRKPPPGRGPATRDPPQVAARSRMPTMP